MRANSSVLSSPTRCLLAKITRLDGTIFGLTDHDAPVTYNGLTYQPYNGVDASNVVQRTGTAPGNLEVTTLQSAISAQVKLGDLLARFYEGARVWVYVVNYLSPSTAMIVNQYFVARFTAKDSSMVVELQELLFRLKSQTGRTLTSGCQAQEYGDYDCDPSQTIRTRDTHLLTVSAVVSNMTLQFSGDTQAAGFYTYGTLKWATGNNAPGPGRRIKLHTVPSGGVCQVVLGDPFVYPVSIGDTANLTRGCDRHVATCKTIVNTHNPSGTNIENNRSVYLPLPDEAATIGR